MEQTTGWAKVFGNSGSGSSIPTFGAAAFQGSQRLSIASSASSNALMLDHRGSKSTPSLAIEANLDIVFERVDLGSVCSTLHVLIASHLRHISKVDSPSSSSSQPISSLPESSSSNGNNDLPNSDSSIPSSSNPTSSNIPFSPSSDLDSPYAQFIMKHGPEPTENAVAEAVSNLPPGKSVYQYLQDIGKGIIPMTSITIKKCSLADAETGKTSQFGNFIRCLPSHFTTISLCDCILSETAIASLCYGVLGSNYIKCLLLKHNTLGSDRIKGIATGLVTNKVLESLEISFSDSIQSILPYLASSIDDNHTLRSLNLANDKLNDVSPLTSSLRRIQSKITYLDLSNNSLDRGQATSIAEMLMSNTTLESLNLSFNAIADHGAQLLAVALEKNVGLKHLCLDNCSLLDLGISSLAKMLRFNCTLMTLSFAGNTATDFAANSFIEAMDIHRNSTLLELKLEGITTTTSSRIQALLNRNIAAKSIPSSLTFPTFDGNISKLDITSADLQFKLSEMQELKWNPAVPALPRLLNDSFSSPLKLSVLDLRRCGVIRLPPSVGNLSNLKLLDLRCNQMRLLCPEISLCKQLEILKLSDNLLEYLPSELCQLSSLVELHLYGNPLSMIPDAMTRINGTPDGPSLDASLPDMNIYRFHHVNFQQSHLMSYLKSIYASQSSDIDWTYAGIAVVGPEKSGKTTLLNTISSHCNKKFKQWEAKVGAYPTYLGLGEGVSERFRSSNIEAPFDSESKKAVSVGDIMLLHEDPPKKFVAYHLICHDLNGAEHFKPLHTFVVGIPCLYIITMNLSEYPANSHQIDYWINTIVARVGKSCSILLVGTHSDTRFCGNKNAMRDMLAQLKKDFKDHILDFAFIDTKAKPDKLLKQLTPLLNMITTIGKQRLMWGSKVPYTFIRTLPQVVHLRDHLDCSVCHIDTFHEHMGAAGIRPNQIDAVMSRLNSIGLIRDFPLDRKVGEWVFIDTSFLYNSLSEFVSSVIISKANGGTITRKLLDTCWSPLTKLKMRSFALRLAENFELLAIDYTHLDERLTLPNCLPLDSPSLSSYWSTQPKDDLTLLQRWFEFPFLPNGAIAKIIGACLQVPNWEFATVWAHGIVIRSGFESAKMDYIKDKCAIQVQAMSQKNKAVLLREILNLLTSIFSVWFSHLEFKTLIPYTNATVHFVAPQPDITKIISMGKDTYYGPAATASIPIADMAPDLIIPLIPLSISGNSSRTTISKSNLGIVSKATIDGTTYLCKEATAASDLGMANVIAAQSILTALTAFSKQTSYLEQLKSIGHTNLISLRSFSAVPHFSIYSTYIDAPTLPKYLEQNYLECTWTLKIKILMDVAFAVEHLHRQSPTILHGAIKPNNIFVPNDDASPGVSALTSDFGIWPMLHKLNGNALPNAADWMWHAPEVFTGGPMTPKSDAFSFGTLVWYLWNFHELVTGDGALSGIPPNVQQVLQDLNFPFQNFSAHYPSVPSLQHAIHRKYLRPHIPIDNTIRQGYVSLELLIRNCWKANPDERPDFTSIIKRLLSISDLMRNVTNSGLPPNTVKLRSTFSVNMKQLQHSKSWQLLASYAFKGEVAIVSCATCVPFKIPNHMVHPNGKPTALIPAPEQSLAFLASSTLWLGTSKNFIRLMDLRDGRVSQDFKLDNMQADRPEITFTTGTTKIPSRVETSRNRVGWSAASSPPPMLNTKVAAAPTTTPTTTPTTIKKEASLRIVGCFSVNGHVWCLSEDKTLSITLETRVISRVPINHHPICVARSGDFGYVGCGEGIVLELDLTRTPKDDATSIDYYKIRSVDTQGNPVYSIHVDDANLFIGTKGDVMIIDRLSAHKYFSWNAHTDRVVGIVKISGSKCIWTASDDRSIKVWPIRTSVGGAVEILNSSHPERTLLHHTQRIKDMILCGNYVMSIAGENTAVWDTITGVVVKVLPHTGFANAIAFIDHSTFVTISSNYNQQTSLNDNYVQVWSNGINNLDGTELPGVTVRTWANSLTASVNPVVSQPPSSSSSASSLPSTSNVATPMLPSAPNSAP